MIILKIEYQQLNSNQSKIARKRAKIETNAGIEYGVRAKNLVQDFLRQKKPN